MSSEVTSPAADSTSTPGAASGAPARKKGLFLGGGVAGVIALAWALSLVAVPSKGGAHGKHALAGPFLAGISPSAGFQVNLAGDGGKHYLQLKVDVEAEAYDEGYVTARSSDPLHQAKVTDAVLRTAARKTKGELDNAVGREVFREELREALDPALFPVHVGEPGSPDAAHAESGLRPGRSIDRATMRGLFYAHALRVDGKRRSVRLDDGAEVLFRGDEDDLFVGDARGKGVYLDVSGVHADFAGEVPIGTLGRVRNVYFNTFLTQ